MDYLWRFFDIEGSDPQYYHIVMNAGKWEVEAAAQLIADAASRLSAAAA
jgi:hypothetical protein